MPAVTNLSDYCRRKRRKLVWDETLKKTSINIISGGGRLGFAGPNTNRLVIFKRTGSNDILSWMGAYAKDNILMSLEGLKNLFGLQIPDVDFLVLRARDDTLGIGSEGRKNLPCHQ